MGLEDWRAQCWLAAGGRVSELPRSFTRGAKERPACQVSVSRARVGRRRAELDVGTLGVSLGASGAFGGNKTSDPG